MMIRFVLAGLCATLAGCLSASAPLEIQWYSLEAFREPARISASGPEVKLKLLHIRNLEVRESGSIEERFSTLTEGGRVGYAEGLRWIEGPGSVLERRLLERLFRSPHLDPGPGNDGVELLIELQEFGERAADSRREARIVLEVSILQNRRLLDLRRHEVARVVEDFSPAALVEALSGELDSLSDSVIEDLLEIAEQLDPSGAATAESSGGAG